MRQFVYWVFLLCIAAALGGSVAYAARPWYDAATVASGFTKQLSTSSIPTFTPTAVLRVTRTTVVPSATPTIPPFKSPSGRVNYLILGSDNDAKNQPGTFPDTQVIIFVSYDTVHKQIYMVSIPRDLYVSIPGFIYDKIDTAPTYGNLETVIQTVESDFHVTIDHYGWVGLQGFVSIIQSLGGVDIDVAHPMVENDFPDDLNPLGPKYAIRRFFIPAGPQHLNGTSALEYVRARHADLIGDFGRSQRQQQILLQIKQKLKGVDISEFPNLVEDLKGQVMTDLGWVNILSLVHSVLGIPSASIHHYYLDEIRGYTQEGTSQISGDILVPVWPKIYSLFSCIMSDKAYLGCKN